VLARVSQLLIFNLYIWGQIPRLQAKTLVLKSFGKEGLFERSLHNNAQLGMHKPLVGFSRQ
jgi:hypothetical protein